MRISASIYSDKQRSLEQTIQDLAVHKVDLLHVDCNDDPRVFEDIKQVRSWCSIPIDLHIITAFPSKYYDLLRETPVEYVTFQLEDLKEDLAIPADISGKKGLAIITPTPIDTFDAYASFDFILIMATIPGQSGGKFDSINFKKIRDFQKKYPTKSVHVDGGVNGEVSFILRNMGVHTSVSGSYLFNAPSIGHALMDLTKRDVNSQFKVQDFMIPLEEAPFVFEEQATIQTVLSTIERGALGFTLVLSSDHQLTGIISNADIRKALLKFNCDLNQATIGDIKNSTPKSIESTATVNELLQTIKRIQIPIMYLPVVSEEGKAVGILTFLNLIKGEI